MSRDKPLKLEIPARGADRPQLGRVGLIAAVGFVVGVVWPWLAGVTLAPRPPSEELSIAKPDSKKRSKKSPATSKAKTTNTHNQVKQSAASKRIKVGKPVFTSCRDDEGRTVSSCDPIPIDELVVPRIEALQGCKASQDVQGTLSLGMKIDFESNRVNRLLQGKSTTLPDGTAKALLECAERELKSTSFSKVPHNHESYTVFFLVEVVPPHEAAADNEAPGGKPNEEVTQASGMATVEWVAARVRSGPTKDSKEIARLATGARVKVIGKKGDWYKVAWDSKGSEGWVFKGAIGM